MYYDISVEISSIPGKTVLLKKKDVTYVQLELERVYNPQKKYNVPKRKLIGKLSSNPACMHPNEAFFELFPDFSSSNDAEPIRSSGLQAGLFLAIRKIARKDGIEKKLHSGLLTDTGLLMDLAACQVLNEVNDGNYYDGYAYKHPLFSDRMQIFSDAAVSLFLQELGQEGSADFLAAWNAGRDHRQRICVSFNCADKTHKAGDIRLLENSIIRQKAEVPLFNIALACNQGDKVPLFYEEYTGSIAEARQLDDLCGRIQAYKYKDICFVIDRGDIAPDMLRYIDEHDFSFIMMASGCSPLASSEIESCRNVLKKDKERLIEPNLYGMTTTKKLYDGDKDRYVHIYCNTAEEVMERMEFEARIAHMSEQLNGLAGYAVPVMHPYTEYFTCSYDSENKLIRAEKKEDAVRKRLELCGYFCLITSEKMTAADAYFLYKGRHLSDNYFRTEKSLIQSVSTDLFSDKAMSGKFFAEFIALIIKSRLWALLQKKRPGQDKTEGSLDVMEAVQELEKIEMVRRNNGKYTLDSTLTKTQKEILLSLGMKMEDVQADAAKISDILSKATTEIYTVAEEDETFWL